MVEKKEAVRIPPASTHGRVTIHCGLTSDPETVESRKNDAKSIICCGYDAGYSRRIRQRLSVLLAHGSGSNLSAVSQSFVKISRKSTCR